MCNAKTSAIKRQRHQRCCDKQDNERWRSSNEYNSNAATSDVQDDKRRQSSDGVIGTTTMSDKDIDGCDERRRRRYSNKYNKRRRCVDNGDIIMKTKTSVGYAATINDNGK